MTALQKPIWWFVDVEVGKWKRCVVATTLITVDLLKLRKKVWLNTSRIPDQRFYYFYRLVSMTIELICTSYWCATPLLKPRMHPQHMWQLL